MPKVLTKRNGITALICFACIYAANNVQFVKNIVGEK